MCLCAGLAIAWLYAHNVCQAAPAMKVAVASAMEVAHAKPKAKALTEAQGSNILKRPASAWNQMTDWVEEEKEEDDDEEEEDKGEESEVDKGKLIKSYSMQQRIAWDVACRKQTCAGPG